MAFEFTDFLELKLLRAQYERLSEELHVRDPRKVGSAVRKLLNAIDRVKGTLSSLSLRKLIETQERVGRELLAIIKFRYVLTFFFKSLFNRLVERLARLISLTNSILSFS